MGDPGEKTARRVRAFAATLLFGLLGGALPGCSLVLGFEEHEPFPETPSRDGGTAGADGGTGKDDLGAGDAATPTTALTLVGSRTTLSSGPTVDVPLPAGSRPGDLVVLVEGANGTSVQSFPDDWSVAGTGTTSAGGTSFVVYAVAYHPLTAAEDENTKVKVTFPSTTVSTSIAIVYRGARTAQPVAPIVSASKQPATQCIDSQTRALYQGANLVARAPATAGLFVVGTYTSDALAFAPELGELDLLESGRGLGVYVRREVVSAGTTVTGPLVGPFAMPGGCPTYFTATLGVVSK